MTKTFTTPGMNCGKCAARITTALTTKPGVAEVKTDVPTKQVHVTFSEREISTGQIATALAEAGYPANE
ncbi:MAG TPA: heavy-metal-associated domain-containing protein [Tepidisphaeraceae bacterium]|jgi:copper chaperone|nr:heavy-metal-associated domain-containing protein [Tepidisphaeraceae bacterium]